MSFWSSKKDRLAERTICLPCSEAKIRGELVYTVQTTCATGVKQSVVDRPERDRRRPEQRNTCGLGGWIKCPVLTLLSLLLDSSVTWPSGEACCSGWCSSVSTQPSGPRFPSHQTCWGRSVRTFSCAVSCSVQRRAVASAASCCFLNTHTMLGKELSFSKSACT